MADCLLRQCLAAPARLSALSLAQWQLLVRLGRTAHLLGRLHALVAQRQLLDQVPAPARRHLESADVYARKQQQAVRYECYLLQRQLQACGCQPIFLKGAAYLLAELRVSQGRIFADIDVLVDKAQLPQVEGAMFAAGWLSKPLDDHDSYYYREWIHEIPPMKHLKRGAEVDIHHNILPPISGEAPDSELLRQHARPVADGMLVMAPEKMLLHSAVHLFTEGELHKGLRDLSDLDWLLREFSQQPGFWGRLLQQAGQLGLGRYLYYALRNCRILLATPVPDEVEVESRRWAPGGARVRVMDWIYRQLLVAHHGENRHWRYHLAAALAFVRGHVIKMPWHVLIPHLLHKAFYRKKLDTVSR